MRSIGQYSGRLLASEQSDRPESVLCDSGGDEGDDASMLRAAHVRHTVHPFGAAAGCTRHPGLNRTVSKSLQFLADNSAGSKSLFFGIGSLFFFALSFPSRILRSSCTPAATSAWA